MDYKSAINFGVQNDKFYIQFNGQIVGEYDDVPIGSDQQYFEDRVRSDEDITRALDQLECDIESIEINNEQKIINVIAVLKEGADPSINRSIEV